MSAAVGNGRAHPRAFGATARLAIVVALVAVTSGCALLVAGPKAREGVLDLSGRDSDSGAVALEGDWEVCWNHFVDPALRGCPYGEWTTYPVPRLWSDSGVESPMGATGIATYRLRIDLPVASMPFAIRVGAPMTAYRLYVDGELRSGAGEASETADGTVPRLANDMVVLAAGAQQVELLVHVANFDFRGGGLRRTWYVGSADRIERLAAQQLLIATVFATTSVVVGLLFLAQFGFRPSERARAWLGIFSVLVGLRLLPASTSGLPQLALPWASFDLLIRLEYMNSALLMAAALQYVRTRLPGVMPPRTTSLLLLACLALVPIHVLAPLPIVLETLAGIALLAPILVFLVMVEYGRARRRGVEEAGPTMWAAIVFSIGIAHDIVRTYTGIGARIELFPYFVIFWVSLESYFLLRSYAKAHTTVEAISEELDDANFELKASEDAIVRFVPFDLVRMLGKQSIRDVEGGDHTRVSLSVLHLTFRSAPSPADLASRAEGFDVGNEYVGRLERVVHRHHGFLHEFRESGIQVFFPGGVADAIAAGRALLDEERVDFPVGDTRSRVSSEAAVGIDHGPLVIGMFGSPRQLMRVVYGESLAKAVEIAEIALDTPGNLLISEGARAALADPSAWAPQAVATLAVEGSSEGEALYAVGSGA